METRLFTPRQSEHNKGRVRMQISMVDADKIRRGGPWEAPDEQVVVTAGLVATGGSGVQDIKVALALSDPEAMRLFQRGREDARSFKSAGQPAQSA